MDKLQFQFLESGGYDEKKITARYFCQFFAGDH